MANKQITLTIEEWKAIDFWLGTHHERQNIWKNDYGEQSEYYREQEILWEKEYDFTEQAIKKLNKKLYN